ncbi:Uma2 family endonuclease [Allocoleopsis sp.]|uniref:Uma2 family endonuclease n=1 Tax=Allocoleopsis sp. TaxID=3088169 RepID=UPI002FD477B3
MADSWAALTEEELMRMSLQNPELRFERKPDGTLVTLPPTGGISGNREAKAVAYLLNWVESHNLGEVFGPGTGFILGCDVVQSSNIVTLLMPDAAFVAKGRLPEGWDKGEDTFLNLAPDFVIEICAKTENLETIKARMQESVSLGVQLGWLIDHQNEQALIYRADGHITQYPATAILSGEDVVPGFKLALKYLL